MQFFQGHTFSYAACSLQCLPHTAHYIENLKMAISKANGNIFNLNLAESSEEIGNFPVINSAVSLSDQCAADYTNEQSVVEGSIGSGDFGALNGLNISVGTGTEGVDVSQCMLNLILVDIMIFS